MEAGHAELGSEQPLHADLPQALDNLLVAGGGQILGDGAVELAAQLEGVVQGVADSGPGREQGSRHQDHTVEQTWSKNAENKKR